jgi:hypothetical protein
VLLEISITAAWSLKLNSANRRTLLPLIRSIPVNYFAHAHRFLLSGNPDSHFLAGTAVPDWLNVVARRTRCHPRHVEPYLQDPDPTTNALARGIAQHHADDRWFHATRTFNELSIKFSQQIHETLADESDLRPSLLGHIVVELLLDAELVSTDRSLLDAYYIAIDSVDAERVAALVSLMSGRPVGNLAKFIPRFVDIQFLADYGEDIRLCYRIDQVLTRVKLPCLPNRFKSLLPGFRAATRQHRPALLNPNG